MHSLKPALTACKRARSRSRSLVLKPVLSLTRSRRIYCLLCLTASSRLAKEIRELSSMTNINHILNLVTNVSNRDYELKNCDRPLENQLEVNTYVPLIVQLFCLRTV